LPTNLVRVRRTSYGFDGFDADELTSYGFDELTSYGFDAYGFDGFDGFDAGS
jgi:hypothetical protein